MITQASRTSSNEYVGDEAPATMDEEKQQNHDKEKTQPSGPLQLEKPPDQLNTAKLLVINIASCLAVLCVALDHTIIATAILRITDQFHALDDVG